MSDEMTNLHKSSAVVGVVIGKFTLLYDLIVCRDGSIYRASQCRQKIWPSFAMGVKGGMIVLILSCLFFSVSCVNDEGGKLNGPNGRVITVKGIVSGGYRHVFDYSVTCKTGVYALDVVALRGVELGKVHVVSGVLKDYGEVVPEWGVSRVLTEVSIDGVRIQTHNEWSEENDLDTEELIEHLMEER